MLKVLIKKQFTELFRGFFYDARKNVALSKSATVLKVLLFAVLMLWLLGGMFTALAISLCDGLVAAGVEWLYFLVFGLLSVLLGVFGSVFNTHSVLYLAKDNDLLLSMPIPVRVIIISRLLSVYLMGLMYSMFVVLPAVIVYWVKTPFDIRTVIGGVALLLVISILVLLLSCMLGWVVARISLKLKHKSFVTVLLSLVFLGVYYFFYFRAQAMLRTLAMNAVYYGDKIKGAAYGLYLFGDIGAGNLTAALLFTLCAVAALAAVWFVLSRSFYKIATATGKTAVAKYKEKDFKELSPFAALVRREFARFVSSPTYMLNCGMGTILLPAAGVALLLKGKDLLGLLTPFLGERADALWVLFCAAVCMVASMNDIAAPAVSMEGKNLWFVKSLPVSSWQALRAKLVPQLAVTLPPLAVCLACGAAALYRSGSVLPMVFSVLTAFAYALCGALFNLFIGVSKPILSWTTEVIPIKQSMSVTVALFSGWGYALLLGGGYMLIGYKIGAVPYLGAFLLLTAAACVLLWRWLKTRGTAAFEAL